MFISVVDLFKIGVGPSSSHTMGPMVAAYGFRQQVTQWLSEYSDSAGALSIRCVLKGSLACTGKGHATDRAVILGLHGYQPEQLIDENVNQLVGSLWQTRLNLDDRLINFSADQDIVFDTEQNLPQHPNGMVFQLFHDGEQVLNKTCFSIGGGFISSLEDIEQLEAPMKMVSPKSCSYPFDSADSMLEMARTSGLSIAQMKRDNEQQLINEPQLEQKLSRIWQAMSACLEKGLQADGELPGGLHIQRRAHSLFHQLTSAPDQANLIDWLCAYAMAVNEENAAGHMVVTAPTNGAAGVIPAVIYYWLHHEHGQSNQVADFLLTAAAIGGLIKHRSSISGAEVGCQGEVGSAAAMAAAGLCAVKGGTPAQIENAAEIALEHHLGMTCDPVAGLVQVPCIERNGFGAIKAYTAASLALRGNGRHFMPLDSCIAAMKQTGLEMSEKYKETSLGGLAVTVTEC